MSGKERDMPLLLRFERGHETGTYGGTLLKELFGRPGLPDDACGSVEFRAEKDGGPRVSEGPCAGMTFSDLIAEFGVDIAGRELASLLAKDMVFEVRLACAGEADSPVTIIYGDDKDKRAQKPTGAAAVLYAEDRARFYYGRRRSLSADRFFVLARKSPGHEILQERKAEAGQVFLIPPSLPYSLGAGVVAYTASIEKKGKDRAVGLPGGGLRGGNIARDLDPTPVPDSRLFVSPRGWVTGMNAITWLYATATFSSVRLDLREQWTETYEQERKGLAVVTCVKGDALIVCGDDTETLGNGITVVATGACPGLRINPGPAGVSAIFTWFPEKDSIDALLRKKGMSQREIEGLFGFFGRE